METVNSMEGESEDSNRKSNKVRPDAVGGNLK